MKQDRVEISFNGLILNLLKEDVKQVTKDQLETIRKYDKKKIRNSKSTRKNQIFLLMQFARTVKKPFNKVTEDDIIDFQSRKKHNGEELKPGAVNWNAQVFKQFFEILGKKKVVEDLRQIPVDDFIDARDLWTEGEIKQLINTANHPRDKALISILFDLAVERKTIREMNIGDIEITPEVYITVNGKKRGIRQKRRLKCITSAPYVVAWLDNHPYKNQPDKPFFIRFSPHNYGMRVSNNFVYNTLQLLSKRTGINKKIRPHLIRHSALTNLYRRGYRGVHLQRFAGWTSGAMEQRYVNLADEEIDAEREMALNGSPPEIEKIQPSDLMSLECPRCKHKNPATNHYCQKCWLPLNRKIVDVEMQILEMLRSKWYKTLMEDVKTKEKEMEIPHELLQPENLVKVYNELIEKAKLTPEERQKGLEKQIAKLR
jgi:integrase